MAEVLIEFSSRTFGVVSFGPVISSPGLSEHEVVRSEDLTKGARPHAVHGAGLQINQHGLEFQIQLIQMKCSSSSSGWNKMAGILAADLFNVRCNNSLNCLKLTLGTYFPPVASL